jgi:DNA polymerase
MDDRVELLEAVRALRAHLLALKEQGLAGLPVIAEAPARAQRGVPAAQIAPSTRVVPSAGLPQAASEAQAELIPRMQARGHAAPVKPPPEDLGPQRPLSAVREELGECTRCKLSQGRTNIVFGVGSPTAEILFIGEGPGRDEDLQGEPFVGAAGKLLTRIIEAMGLRREEVYIANVVKCRPPQNRDPEPDEVAACSPFLFQQIASIRPRIIVGLGRPAVTTLLGAPPKLPITRLRGRWLTYRGQIPIMPTFHPAYLLRNPAAKREVWEDMKEVVAEYERLTGKKLSIAGKREGGA